MEGNILVIVSNAPPLLSHALSPHTLPFSSLQHEERGMAVNGGASAAAASARMVSQQ